MCVARPRGRGQLFVSLLLMNLLQSLVTRTKRAGDGARVAVVVILRCPGRST